MAKKKEPDKKESEVQRGIPEYFEGRKAHRTGKKSDVNPYPSNTGNSDTSTKRVAWFNGYYDSWRQDRHGVSPGEKILRAPGEVQ